MTAGGGFSPGVVSDSRLLFTLLVALVAGVRLLELAISRRNVARLRARGGHEVGRGHYPVMVLLHAGILISCVAEVWLLDRPFLPALGWPMIALVAATMVLRWWVIFTLGDRWTTTVWVVPGEPPVTGGPFRWLRHPNYLAVAVELFALPLVHTAWCTSLLFGGADLVLLAHRIRVEEGALEDVLQ